MELAEWTELCRQKEHEKGLPESKLLIGTLGNSNRKKLQEKECDPMKHVLKHGKMKSQNGAGISFHGQSLQVTNSKIYNFGLQIYNFALRFAKLIFNRYQVHSKNASTFTVGVTGLPIWVVVDPQVTGYMRNYMTDNKGQTATRIVDDCE